jgi:hypothetical protein
VFRILLSIFLLNAYDAFITLASVKLGAHEANPILSDWVHNDPNSFVLWKTIVCCLALAGLALGYKYHEQGPSFKRTSKILMIIYINVCIWNSLIYMSLVTFT